MRVSAHRTAVIPPVETRKEGFVRHIGHRLRLECQQCGAVEYDVPLSESGWYAAFIGSGRIWLACSTRCWNKRCDAIPALMGQRVRG